MQHWNYSAAWAVHGGVALRSPPSSSNGTDREPVVLFGSIDYSFYAVKFGVLQWKFPARDIHDHGRADVC